MPAAREAARRLAKEGTLEILQKGAPVDPDSFKGPIRLRALPPAAVIGRRDDSARGDDAEAAAKRQRKR